MVYFCIQVLRGTSVTSKLSSTLIFYTCMENKICNSTKFKLVCAYSHKFDGTLYSKSEINYAKNIIQHNSKDYALINNNITITRHDLAFLYLIEHIYRKWEYIDNCTMFMNDHSNCQEIKIGVWDKLVFSNNQLANLILERQSANVVCLGIDGNMK